MALRKRTREEEEDLGPNKRFDQDYDSARHLELDINETAAKKLEKGTRDRISAFKIIQFVTLEAIKDYGSVPHRISIKDRYFSLVFTLSGKDEVQESFLHSIKRVDSSEIDEVILYWIKEMEFEIKVRVNKTMNRMIKKTTPVIGRNVDKEMAILMKKMNSQIKPLNAPDSWERDKKVFIDIIKRIYSEMEENIEDIPVLKTEVNINQEEKSYILSVSGMERVRLSFLKEYKKKFFQKVRQWTSKYHFVS